MPLPKRLILKVSDLQILYGCTPHHASKLMQRLSDSLGKKKGQKITIGEFSKSNDMDEEEVRKSLGIL